MCLIAILNHIIGDATHVSVDIAKAVAIAVGGIMDADDKGLGGAIDDDALGRLAVLLASSLHIGRTALLIVDLSTSKGVAARFKYIKHCKLVSVCGQATSIGKKGGGGDGTWNQCGKGSTYF